MSDTNGILVDTQEWVVPCNKFNPPAIINMSDCAKCSWHSQLTELWPGKKVFDKQGNQEGLAHIPVEVDAMCMETKVEGHSPHYRFKCGLPKWQTPIMKVKVI